MANEFNLSNLRVNGLSAPILDTLGLNGGDPVFTNLSIVEGAIEKGHEQSEQLRHIAEKLHSFIGVRARVYEIESDLKEAYTNHVAKEQDD